MQPFKFQEIIIGNKITLKKHDLSLAQTMFNYIDQDRERLDQFLPWVPFIKTVEDEVNYIKSTHENWEDMTEFDYGIFLNETNTHVGNLGVHSLRFKVNCAEIGYWILGKYEGQGLMSEAVMTMEKYLFENGFNRVQIRCSTLNDRSAGVPLRCGYTFEGVLRDDTIEKDKYRDTKVFSKLKRDYETIKPTQDFNLLLKQHKELMTGNFITDLSNTSAFIFEHIKDLNWAGFYLKEGDVLLLGPFQGKVACTKIPLTKGVCGHSASTNQTIIVPDVHKFAGHIACDSRSNSEVVIPLRQNGEVIGVLDIDSPTLNRFHKHNLEIIFLENIAEGLSR